MYLILFVLIFLSLFSFFVAQARQIESHTLGVVLNVLLCTGWLVAAVYVIKQILTKEIRTDECLSSNL